MKRAGLITAFALFFLLSVNASAISTICDLETLPSYPSANSSTLMIIPRSFVQEHMGNFSQPMKISWVLRDMDFFVLDEGAFIKFKDCWVCEFSGKTSNFYGSCGPTPLRSSGQFTLYFTAKDFSREQEFNRTVIVHSLMLAAGVNVDSTGKVLITVDAPTNTQEVWMTLYSADDGRLIQDYNRTSLKAELYPGRYTMSISSLPLGSYYASFIFRTIDGETGGAVSKFDIRTREVELAVQTDSNSYWLGEEVQISGQTKYDQVSASVRLPNGRVESLGTKTVTGQQFIYTFRLLNTYGEGIYTVSASAGGNTEQRTFTVQKVLEVSPSSIGFTVTNRTDAMERTITIRNVGNETVTLSALTEGLGTHVTADFDRMTLTGSTMATLTVRLNPATTSSGVTGKVLITGNGIVTVPVDVVITLNLPGAVTQGGGLKVSPGLWQPADCQVGKLMSPTLTIQNTGKGAIGDFSSTVSTELNNVVDVTVPSSDIQEGSTASGKLDITPNKEVTSGWVEIKSSGGSATVYISLDCAPDLTDGITTLESDVADLKANFRNSGFSDTTVSRMFDSLDSELADLTSKFASGEFAESKRIYSRVRVMLDTLSAVYQEVGTAPPPPAGGGDNSWVSIVVVVIVLLIIGLLGYFLYSRFGSKVLGGKGGEGEESYEEELY